MKREDIDIRKTMDRIYEEMPLEEIPWNRTEPPAILTEAVSRGKIKPCRAVDLGCGAGNYSVWFAMQGFDMTGIDISPRAVEHARQLAKAEGVEKSCKFVAADLLGDLSDINDKFEFACDWELMHHIFPEDRPQYIRNVHSLLIPGSLYFSISFSENSPSFGGQGKLRQTPLGTTLYFSSEDELKELFGSLFTIEELKTVEIPGSRGTHLAVAVWMKA